MRVAIVTARFRARAPFDLTSQARSLAPALARAGAQVEVFCGAGGESGLVPFAQRRIEVIDHVQGQTTFGVTTFALPDVMAEAAQPDFEARVAEGFGAFLDRERPDVVHFERLDVFGTDLVREAKSRKIRTVYCAADTWPAHDRSSLLLPNLEPFELGDGEAEARATLVEEEFGVGPLVESDTHSAEDARRVRHLLCEPLTDLDDVARLRQACEDIEARRASKRVALSAVDRRFATTRLLAKNLSASVGRAFTFRASGVDKALFQAPSAPRELTEAPRVLALGDSNPEGGIDVLLGALEEMGDKAADLRLILALECSDTVRDSSVARRANELEIETRWTRGPADVNGLLKEVSAVVVTQRWGEVLPAACQVALASGIPLVAARTPGVTEGVSSTAGQLVTPANPSALATTLGGLLGEEGALKGLLGGAFDASRAAKSVDDEAREWLDTYSQLLDAPATARTSTSPPAKGAANQVSERLSELRALSHAELFDLAQEGVGKLRRAFGLQDSEGELLKRAVARGGAGRDRAMAESRTMRELESSLGQLRAAREGMRLEEAAREQRVMALQASLHEYEDEIAAKRDALQGVQGDVETARENADEARREAEKATEAAKELQLRISELEAEGAAHEEVIAERDLALATRDRALKESAAKAADLAQAVSDAMAASRANEESSSAEIASIMKELENARRAIQAAEAERGELARTLEERDGWVRAMREKIGASTPEVSAGHELAAELASIEAFCSELERDTTELKRHDAWMSEQTERLREAFGASWPEGGERQDLEEGIERAVAALSTMASELDWRRSEMVAAREAGSAFRSRVLGGPLARRVSEWRERAGGAWGPIPLDRAPAPMPEVQVAGDAPQEGASVQSDPPGPLPDPAPGSPAAEASAANARSHAGTPPSPLDPSSSNLGDSQR